MLWTIFILFIIWLVLVSVYQEELFDAFEYVLRRIKGEK